MQPFRTGFGALSGKRIFAEDMDGPISAELRSLRSKFELERNSNTGPIPFVSGFLDSVRRCFRKSLEHCARRDGRQVGLRITANKIDSLPRRERPDSLSRTGSGRSHFKTRTNESVVAGAHLFGKSTM